MLTDAKIKAAKAREKAYKLGDSNQLYLYVSTTGTRSFRMNYTFGRNAKGDPKQKTLTLGTYPIVTLAQARTARDEARALLHEGKDPAVEKALAAEARSLQIETTFESVAADWFELNSGWSLDLLNAYRTKHNGKWSWKSAQRWTASPAPWSAVHSADVLRSLERDIYPQIGSLPITAIKAPRLLKTLQKVEERGSIETAHRLRQRCEGIFAYAIGAGMCEANPAAGLVVNLRNKPKSRGYPSIVDGKRELEDQIAALRQMLVDCEAERCRAATKFALRFIALTATRPNEIAGAAWDEIHGAPWSESPSVYRGRPLWIIPAARMKGDNDRKERIDGDHIVPLSRQAVAVLETVRQVTGNLPLIFPSERNPFKPMSENTLRALLIRAGYGGIHVPHGFRAAFSTIMNERANRQWREAGHKDIAPDRAIIDLMLAHVPTNKVEGAYNRAAYMERRRELAQEWADLLLADFWPPEIHLGQPIRYAATGPGRAGSRATR